jgi:hypothetical protein
MTIQAFVNKAAAQRLNLSNINVNTLNVTDMEHILEGKCVCCGSGVHMDPDFDGIDHVGYTQDLFCDGCVDHVPVDILYRYGVISKEECDMILNFEDEYRCDDDMPF